MGGTARYVGLLVSSAQDNGYEAALATGYVQGSEIEDDVVSKLRVTRIPHLGRKIAPLNDLRAFFELRRIIRQSEPEIVHSHTFKAGLIARLIPGKFMRVHTFHGHLFEDQSFSPIKKVVITYFEKVLAIRSDVLISVGKKVGVEIRERGIGKQAHWESIAPGVEPLKLIAKGVARQSLGIPEVGLIVGWMARVTSVKNPFLALEIAQKFPETFFVLAGGGDLLDVVRKAAPANVKVIGWVDPAMMWSAVDIVLSTSQNEGMPIALIEAQLAGLPVVTSEVGSVIEVIENNVTGFVTDNSALALEVALKQLLTNQNLIRKFGLAGAASAKVKFEISKMIQKHKTVYTNLI